MVSTPNGDSPLPDCVVSTPGGDIRIQRDRDGTMRIDGKRIEMPDISIINDRKFIQRIAPDGEGGFTVGPLTEAFRWSGLNLAAIDPQLGRYFGADSGVLVVSAGNDLQGLQAGDVIQKIDGATVTTPREAMTALRAKPADSNVDVEYLRDHKPARAQIKVPKATPVQLFRTPTPPPASN
jgi:membrane-associated protease RseP (regulator of RpoE activity)